MDWKRPENIGFPTVWATFEGKEREGGIKNQYWIQDLTSDYHEEVLRHMSTKFIRKSPICIYTSKCSINFSNKVDIWYTNDSYTQHMILITSTRIMNKLK